MPRVQALSSFDHEGPRRKGDQFNCSDATARELMRRNLAKVVASHVEKAAGKKSSASRAAPASEKQTSKKSDNGAAKATSEALSSQTPPAE